MDQQVTLRRLAPNSRERYAGHRHTLAGRRSASLFGAIHSVPPRGYALIAKTNPRSDLESTRTSKNEPKTNLNEPETNPRSECGLFRKSFGISRPFGAAEDKFIGTLPQSTRRFASRSD